MSVSVYLAGKYEDTILMSSALKMGPLWSSEPCKSLTVCKVIYTTPIISIAGLTTKLYDTLHTKKLQPPQLFFSSTPQFTIFT